MSPFGLYQQGEQQNAVLQGQQQAMQAPPPPDQDFSTSDNIRYMQLQAAQSQVEKQLSDNEIYPHEAEELKSQFMPQLTKLQQKKQATQARQAAQAKQQAMDGTAMEEAVRMAHRVARKNAFPAEVADMVDPVTGEHAHFVQDDKGNWKEVEFARAHKKAEMYAASPDQSFLGEDPGLPPVQMATGESRSSLLGSSPNASPPEQQGQPVSIEQFGAQQRAGATDNGYQSAELPKILNSLGENIDRRLVPRAEPGAGEDLNHVSVAAGKEFYKRANAMVPPLGPNASPHEQLARQQQVDELTRQQVSQHLLMKRHVADRKAASEEHKQKLELQAQMAKEKLEYDLKTKHADWLQKLHEKTQEGKGTTVGGLSDRDYVSSVRKYESKLEKDHNKLIEDKKEPNPEIATPEARRKKAQELAEQDVEMIRDRKRTPEQKQARLNAAVRENNQATSAIVQQRQADTELDAVSRPGEAQEKETPEALAQPSPIGHRRVQELLPIVRKGLEAEAASKPLFGLQRTEPRQSLRALEGVLKKAAARGDGLTIGERKEYERVHRELARLLKDHGGAAGLKLLE